MRYRFFTIPIHGGEAAEAELNRCLAEARMLTVDRQFVADGANSVWAVCVAVHDGDGRSPPATRRAAKIDYKEVLNADDFAVFARLRDLRKQLAERDGVPPYAVFTNEQLAAIVQGRVSSAAALKAIDGIGDARVEKYAAPVLAIMTAAPPAAEAQVSSVEA